MYHTETVFGAHPTASGCTGLRWNLGVFALEKLALPTHPTHANGGDQSCLSHEFYLQVLLPFSEQRKGVQRGGKEPGG